MQRNRILSSVVSPLALAQLAKQTKNKRLIGLDVSPSTVGLALSDTQFNLATPFVVLARNSQNEQAVFGKLREALVNQLGGNVCGLVVGWPLAPDGSADASCFQVQKFAKHLMQLEDIPPLAYWDERGTSIQARKLLGDSRRKTQKYDNLAAMFILQSYLDEFFGDHDQIPEI